MRAPLGAKLVGIRERVHGAAGLGRTFTVTTDNPLLPSMNVEVPVGMMVREGLRENWPVLAGGALVLGLVVFMAARAAQ